MPSSVDGKYIPSLFKFPSFSLLCPIPHLSSSHVEPHGAHLSPSDVFALAFFLLSNTNAMSLLDFLGNLLHNLQNQLKL